MSVVRFLADEDLRRAIVHAVLRLEPSMEMTTIQEVGRSGATDDEVLDYAKVHGWLLVSHDVSSMRGFAEHRIANGESIPGLFLVPQQRSTKEIAESLVLIWSASDFEEWEDQITYLPL